MLAQRAVNLNIQMLYCRGVASGPPQLKKKLGILGVPFAKGQAKDGVQLAPDMLRDNGLIENLKKVSNGNLLIKDYGNLEYSNTNNVCKYGNMKNYNEFVNCNQALINKAKSILKDNDEILTIGGDHAIGFGSIAAHLQHTANLSVVWVDAHADINTNTSSSSGHIHGMPLSFLIPELRSHWTNMPLDKMAPVCLKTDQLIYIGLRDVDPYEAYLLKKYRIQAHGMDAIEKYGIDKIMEMTLDGIKSTNKIHISFDIDALDTTIAPSTGTPVHAGLTLGDAKFIVNTLRNTERVEGFDLVEINPKLGTPEDVEKTLFAGMELLKNMYNYTAAYEYIENENTN